MPQNLRGRRPRRFGHNLLIRGGLRAYALTLALLGFECTWYEIKSRGMNEKGKEFIFYNKPYAFSRSSWSIAHGVCTLPCPCSYPSARSACTHTVVLPAAALAKGVEGCMFSNVFFLFPLND